MNPDNFSGLVESISNFEVFLAEWAVVWVPEPQSLQFPFSGFLEKEKNFSTNAWLDFSLIFTLVGFEAMRFSTSSRDLVCDALDAPMAFIWHISVPVTWLRFSRVPNALSKCWLESTAFFLSADT